MTMRATSAPRSRGAEPSTTAAAAGGSGPSVSSRPLDPPGDLRQLAEAQRGAGESGQRPARRLRVGLDEHTPADGTDPPVARPGRECQRVRRQR